MSELWDTSKPDVEFKTAQISFPGYEYYLGKAKEVAEYISGIDLTEENIKETKKELARARKITDELSARRIAIKKEILKDFDLFEGQVKEISGVISEAEGELRTKVREIEEQERNQKKAEIRDIWDKRINHYAIVSYQDSDLLFETFLSPQMLNKTASIKDTESKMIEWLERTEKDLRIAETIDPEVIVNYVRCFDLAEAMAQYNEKKEISEKVAASKEEEPEESKYAFVVAGEKEAKFAEMVLSQNYITFEKRRI